MRVSSVIPLVVSLLVGSLLGLVTVGLLRLGRSPAEGHWPGSGDLLLAGLSALAAFAMGVFVTYLLFGMLL
jgi:hypothetical protein